MYTTLQVLRLHFDKLYLYNYLRASTPDAPKHLILDFKLPCIPMYVGVSMIRGDLLFLSRHHLPSTRR